MSGERAKAVGLGLLVLAVVAAAAVLRRADERAAAPVRECADGAACSVEPGATPAPVVVPPSRVPAAVATASAPPSPVATAATTVRREDADRLLAEGKIVEAVEAFRKVVETEPTAKNHGDFGSLLYRLTAFDEAARHLRAAAELDPGNADRWIALANVYYRKVNPGEAWKAEKRARDAEPGLVLGRDAEGMRVRKGEATARQP